MQLYTISDSYIDFLRQKVPKVYSNKEYADGKMLVKKSIIPIVRMYERGPDGEKILKGTLRISDMIPVPLKELIPYNVNNEPSMDYKNLIFSELRYIRKNQEMIVKKALILYQQKTTGNLSAAYIQSALDFKYLESLHDNYSS